MSYRIVREVREALKTGRIVLTGKTGPLDRLVWVLIADDCRDQTRLASVGMDELSEVTGAHRTTISRSIGRLEDAGCIRRISLGNRAAEGKGQVSKYEIPAVIPCSTTATSNGPIDVAVEPIDVAVEPDPCSGAALHIQVGTYPGTYPGVEKPSSLRSDGKEIARSQAITPSHDKENHRPASVIVKEPAKVPIHLFVLREHFTGDPLSAARVTQIYLGISAVTNGQVENVHNGLQRAVRKGLAEVVSGSGLTTALYRPLPTTSWPDEIGTDMAASRTPSHIGPEQS